MAPEGRRAPRLDGDARGETQAAGTARERLDVALVSRGLAESRERGQALIAAGLIRIGGAPATSASTRVADSTDITVTGRDHPWASRGGLKLVAALDAFEVQVGDRTCLDAGASTGGFTDVLLERGARRVYAVDVGHGQLITRIATDPRVTVLDRTNLRRLTVLPGEAPDLVTLDLSFIALRTVLPRVVELAAQGAEILALVKPQFELGRDAVGRGGIVRDVEAGRRGACDLLAWAATSLGATTAGPVPSPVTGAKGNHEWLVQLRLPPAPA